MKLMCRRFSADAVVRPSIYKDKPEDPLGRHVTDQVIFIPKRRPSTPGNTPSKPLEQHMTKNGDVSADTTADETSSTRKGLYSGGVRYFTVDDVRKRKDEVLKAKKSKSKEHGEREVKQAEEKKNPTLSSSCTDVAVIKEKRSKSLSRSTPDINRDRSVSRTRQIDVPRLPFKDESLNDKEDKIASSTLKGQQASFHDSGEREHEGRRQEEEEKKSPALSSSSTDIAVIKYKRSKSLSRSDPDVTRCRSVTRTRQVDGIDVPQLPFTDSKNDKIASSTLKGRQGSFHDRFHDSDAVLKKAHNSSFRDSVGASLSRLRRSESNETPPSPLLLNSERRIRMMQEKSMMTTGGADNRTTKIRGSCHDIVERGRERSHSATRNVVPPPPPRTMFTTSGGNVSDKKGDGWRNQSYQPRSLSLMEYGAIPSRRSLSTNRGRNRITNNIPPRRDVSPNQIDFARPKDLKFDSAEEKNEMKRNCASFMDKKNETHHNSRLWSSKDVQLVVDKKKAENSIRRNSILSSSSESRTITRLSGVQYKGRDRNSQSQSRERNSRSQSRDRSSTVRYKAPPTLPTRSLFQHKPMFGTWGGSGVKVKEDWRNSRPLPCELKLLSR
jgi:hypothetical protein